MLLDKDAILRYGGCFAIALAYVGCLEMLSISGISGHFSTEMRRTMHEIG